MSYPGLDLGLNFGAYLGFHYFFTAVLGCLEKLGSRVLSLTKNNTDFGHQLNNWFTLNIGASFNL
jgi:hypothetical protein